MELKDVLVKQCQEEVAEPIILDGIESHVTPYFINLFGVFLIILDGIESS